MKILGIETSCDETAICLAEIKESPQGEILTILGNQLYSQVSKHIEFGGVMPTLAKREHQKNLVPLLVKCLEESTTSASEGHSSLEKEEMKPTEEVRQILDRELELYVDFIKIIPQLKKPDIDAIAVTSGPGLEPALWVGVNFAKALSALWNIPLYPTNHMEGHIVVAALERFKIESPKFLIQKTKYPAIALLISGGHTQLVLVKDQLDYEIVGNTRDDAVGEAFDKVARIMGLPYPGGPEISKLAKKERLENPNKKTTYPLPRPMLHSKDLDFSFSGLKTAVLYTVQKIPNLTIEIKQEIAKEFEDATIDVLLTKTQKAVEKFNTQTIIIGGGVSASPEIRNRFEKLAKDMGVGLLIPEVSASTDNALMIALAGYLNLKNGKKAENEFRANGNLSL